MKKIEQKLVSFSETGKDMENVLEDLRNGWFIASLVSTGRNFIGILEKKREDLDPETIYIPPRKKIKFSS